MAPWLVQRGAKHLVLVGRTRKQAIESQLTELKEAGAEVIIAPADVADPRQLMGVLAECDRELPPLRGIIHGAGILADAPLRQMSWEQFDRVMAGKVRGAWNLHVLTQKHPLYFFITCSSS